MADFKLKLATKIDGIDPESFDRHTMASLFLNIAAEEAAKEQDFGQVGIKGAWRIEIVGSDGFTHSERRATRRGLIVPSYYQ